MNILFDLNSSVGQLYDSLIGKESRQKALYISFFAQFRSDKKVDHEPLDLCKFIFWCRSLDESRVDVLFSDDLIMDQKRKGKRIPGENTIFLHHPFVFHFKEFSEFRLKKITEILSKEKSAPFFLEKISLQSIFVIDLKPQQFKGELLLHEEMCWQWDKVNKVFNPA
ncbi:hypothetical protein IT402_02020 [Candidatus Nomurabacteria bacterium]|nr:hypothetical protein [Candidatus Nomurabacteria bacterium]